MSASNELDGGATKMGSKAASHWVVGLLSFCACSRIRSPLSFCWRANRGEERKIRRGDCDGDGSGGGSSGDC